MNDSIFHFHSENISFTLKQKTYIRKWLLLVIQKERKQLGVINYIFCNDNYLHHLNLTFLKHDTLTDVITFDYSEAINISGDIFISIERVKENAKKFKSSLQNELHRVMLHGVLHLLGYKDKTTPQRTNMTAKEDDYLSLKKF